MTNLSPLVSVIIPVYNGAAFMREAIDSVLAQTYPNIEVLVINDGSTDDGATHEIAMSYGNRIRYFTKENGGVSTALNLGIRHMRGEYFSWLSHDDMYYPYKIAKCMEAIAGFPERIVYSDYDIIDGSGNVTGTQNFRKSYRSADFEYGLFPVLNGAANGCTMLIHRGHFDRVGLFDETLRTSQDYALFFKMFRGQTLAYVNEPLTKYRSHGAQQTHINPVTVAEGNALWIGIFERLTEAEILSLRGSPRIFWREKADLLKVSTEFDEAAAYALKKYEESVSALRNAKISVIMPFFNRTELIPKTIESVMAQTYTNWELILANDGTTEDISAIEKTVSQDARMKLLHLPHRGVSAARNSAIEASSGEFIAFLDSDDLWVPKKLEKQLAFMLDKGFAFSHTSFEQHYLNGELLKRTDVSNYKGDVFFWSIYHCAICTCCVMLERAALGKARFPEHISMGEDICLWYHFLWRYQVGVVPGYLTILRVQASSASQNVDKKREARYSILGFLLKNYYYEDCMPYIGRLIGHLGELFPPVTVDVETQAKQKNGLPRLVRGIKKYGFKGFCRVLLQKMKRRMRR